MIKEKNYAFLARRGEVHLADRRDATLTIAKNEIEVDDSWIIAAAPPEDPMLKRTVLDLQNYFLVSMGMALKVAVRSADITGKKVILLEKNLERKDLGRGIFSLEVNNDIIRICSSDSRAIWFGALHLEDMMNLREAPFARMENIISKPCLKRREVHSGHGIDEYPDAELNATAHAGFNTIELFIKDIDQTTRGYCNINDLINRAGSYGLDVIFYSYLPSFKHPDDADAEEFFDSIYGDIFRHCPGAAGIALCGESLEFPSKDPATTGKKWRDSIVDGIPDTRPSPGWWPCKDYGDYLRCIERAVHKVKPDAEIIFNTYNWGYADFEIRKDFLEKIFPPKIHVQITFEMFARKKIAGLSCPVMDYTISETNGSYYFNTECETASRQGIEIVATTNTAGATWDFGTVPYVPTPYKWIEKIRNLIKANEDWNIRSFYETHHYGWEPNIVIELMKFSFRKPRVENLEDLLEKLTVRDYGGKAAPLIMKTWRHWSDAMDHYVASNEDQYGPWRVGPSYPFIFHPNVTRTMASKEIDFPTSKHAHFGSAIIKTFYQPYENVNQSPGSMRFPVEIAELKKMLKIWNEGLLLLPEALPCMPANKRPNGEKLAALGTFIRNSIITVIHIKEWWMLNIALQGSSDRSFLLSTLDRLEAIANAEISNAEDTIQAVECDSRLGWEPSMEYVGDKWHLQWKIRQVQSALREIETYRNIINL